MVQKGTVAEALRGRLAGGHYDSVDSTHLAKSGGGFRSMLRRIHACEINF